jgi:hypothetical protein
MRIVFLMLLSFSLFANGVTDWSSPTTLSSAGVDGSDPQIVVDASGNAVALWVENGAVKASAYRGEWGAPTTLAASGASNPRVGIDGSGNVVAVWLEGGYVKTASLPAAESWSSVTVLSDTGAASPQIAVDAAGNAVAVWIQQFVKASIRLVGGEWSLAETLYPTLTADCPRIAIGASGKAIAVWHDVSPNAMYAVSRQLAEGDWGDRILLSDVTYNTTRSAVAIDPSGNAIVTWLSYTGASNSATNVMPQAVEFNSGAWSAPFDLTTAGGVGDLTNLFTCVAFDSVGNAIALWSILDQYGFLRIQENERIDGTWLGFAEIQVDPYACAADLKVSASGMAAVGYMASTGKNPSIGLVVRATSIDLRSIVNNFWSYPVTTSSASEQCGYPKIAVMSDGSNNLYSALIWIAYDGSNKVIQAATGFAAPLLPPLNPSVVQRSRNHGLFTEYYNVFSWNGSPDPAAVEYVVYRDGTYLTRLSKEAYSYQDGNREQNETVTYSVTTLDQVKNESAPVTATLNPPKKK